MIKYRLVGIDGGASKVMVQSAELYKEKNWVSPGNYQMEVCYSDHPDWNPNFIPVATHIQKQEYLEGHIQLNEKENKEHNMIVDMERNGLSRVCKVGSVKISKLKFVEEYKDLYHYVTEVSGTLDKKINLLDIIKAMMPGGSVIGCPKINTLNLLNIQEKDNRNVYTGCFGYIQSNSDMRFNIIIRSILNYKNVCEVSVASGVILGSSARKEYQENYIKAKSLLDIFKS